MTDTMWIIATLHIICGLAAYPIWLHCEDAFSKISGSYSKFRRVLGFPCCLAAGVFALLLGIYMWCEISDWRREGRV
jgi:hypothetical protein